MENNKNEVEETKTVEGNEETGNVDTRNYKSKRGNRS